MPCPQCDAADGVWDEREDGNNECEAFDHYHCPVCRATWVESTDLCDDGDYDDDDDE